MDISQANISRITHNISQISQNDTVDIGYHTEDNIVPCILIEHTLAKDNSTIIYFHDNECDMGTVLNHCMDLASV